MESCKEGEIIWAKFGINLYWPAKIEKNADDDSFWCHFLGEETHEPLTKKIKLCCWGCEKERGYLKSSGRLSKGRKLLFDQGWSQAQRIYSSPAYQRSLRNSTKHSTGQSNTGISVSVKRRHCSQTKTPTCRVKKKRINSETSCMKDVKTNEKSKVGSRHVHSQSCVEQPLSERAATSNDMNDSVFSSSPVKIDPVDVSNGASRKSGPATLFEKVTDTSNSTILRNGRFTESSQEQEVNGNDVDHLWEQDVNHNDNRLCKSSPSQEHQNAGFNDALTERTLLHRCTEEAISADIVNCSDIKNISSVADATSKLINDGTKNESLDIAKHRKACPDSPKKISDTQVESTMPTPEINQTNHVDDKTHDFLRSPITASCNGKELSSPIHVSTQVTLKEADKHGSRTSLQCGCNERENADEGFCNCNRHLAELSCRPSWESPNEGAICTPTAAFDVSRCKSLVEEADSYDRSRTDIDEDSRDTWNSESDEDDLPPAFTPITKYPNDFEKGDVVWAKFRVYPFWPAVFYKRRGKHALVCFFDESVEKRSVLKVGLRNVYPYACDEERRGIFEAAGRQYKGSFDFDAGIEKAEDYIRKKALGKVSDFFGSDEMESLSDDANDEAISTSPADLTASFETPSNDPLRRSWLGLIDDGTDRELRPQTKIKRHHDLLEHIYNLKNVLVKIAKQEILSGRHHTFVAGSAKAKGQLRFSSGFGPIKDEDTQSHLMELLIKWFQETCSDLPFNAVSYISDVWLPEVIIRSLAKMRKLSFDAAEELYLEL